MKRKLAIFGLCFAGAELFAANMPPLVLVPAAALLLLLLFLSIARRSRYLPLALGAAVGLCWFCAFSFVAFRPVRALAGQTASCTVTVETDAAAAYQNGQLRGTLTVTSINGKSCHFKMRSNGFPAQEPGETFTADFALADLPKDAYQASRLSRGILLQGEYTGGYKTGTDSRAPRFALYCLRQNASALLRRWLPRDLGGLEAAMLLGDKTALPDAVQDTFRAAGISHLLAVSGLHLALLCGLFSFGHRRRFYRPLIILRAAVAVFYMLLTGLPVSVLRAGIVFLLVLLGDWFYQPIDLLTLTGAAAVLLGLQNPYAPCDIGFQLSFCAVLGVQASVALTHWEETHIPDRDAEGWRAQLRRAGLALLSTVQTAALAALATLPVLVAQGLTTSGVCVLANLLTVWMLQPALILGIAVLALQIVAIPLVIVAPLAHMASFLLAVWLRIFYALASWCAALPLARLYLPREYTLLVLTLLGVLALVYYAVGKFRWFLPAGAVCAVAAILLGVQMQKGVVTVVLVGTAGNPAVVCVQDGQAVVLFRGGESNLRAVRSYLADHGAAEQVLTVDLRRSGTEIAFDTKDVCTAQDIEAYTTQPALNGLTLDVYHTSGGNLAVVGDGRSHIAVMAGNAGLSSPVAVDVLCAAGALSDSVQPAAILTTASLRPAGLTRRVPSGYTMGRTFPLSNCGPAARSKSRRQNRLLYSENELNKRLRSGCGLYYFYAADEALVHTAAQKALKVLNEDDPETTVLDGPTPRVEEIVLAAGTISFFGGRRLVLMPLIRPSTYSDKDLQDLCDTLADTENAIFVMTSVIEEKFGKLRPGKREQKLISACEKLGYCVQLNKLGRAALQEMARTWAGECGAQFAKGAEAALLDRCGEDQFLLKNEIDKLAALSGYGTITAEMVAQLGTVTLDADTFDMVKLVAAGRTDQAQQKLKTLLALQNEPIMITGALIGNYIDMYRVLQAKRSRRSLADVAKDFGYGGKWSYRLGETERTTSRFKRHQLEKCLEVLQKLDTDLKSSKLDADLLMQKALCELALAGRS